MTPQGTRRLCQPCSEQGKLPAAKAFKFAERDKHMSEQNLSYMQQLDQWIEQEVIDPLFAVWDGQDNGHPELNTHAVRKAIRTKVLESYRNGQKAGPTKPARKELQR